MSLNRKKSRKINVNETVFRWQVVSRNRCEGDPECTDGPSIYYRPCHLYIELSEEPKSQIKLLYFYKFLYIDPDNEKVFEYIKPKLVAEVIKECLEKGWDPNGTQHFELSKKEEKVYSQTEEDQRYHKECEKRYALSMKKMEKHNKSYFYDIKVSEEKELPKVLELLESKLEFHPHGKVKFNKETTHLNPEDYDYSHCYWAEVYAKGAFLKFYKNTKIDKKKFIDALERENWILAITLNEKYYKKTKELPEIESIVKEVFPSTDKIIETV